MDSFVRRVTLLARKSCRVRPESKAEVESNCDSFNCDSVAASVASCPERTTPTPELGAAGDGLPLGRNGRNGRNGRIGRNGRRGRWDRLTRKKRYSNLSDLTRMLASVSRKCSPGNSEKDFEDALTRLARVEAQASDMDLHTLDLGVLMAACLVLVFYFQDRLILHGCIPDPHQSRLDEAFAVFDKVVKRLVPTDHKEVMHVVVATIEQEEAWDREFLCVEVLQRVTHYAAAGPLYIAPLLDVMENMVEDGRIKSARQTIRILYELLGTNVEEHWPRLTQEMVDTVRRLLSIFRASVRPAAEGVRKYAPVGKGLAVCGRRLFDRTHNDDRLQFIDALADWCMDSTLPEDALMEFAYLLEMAATRHVTQLYQDTLTPSLLYSLMSMVASESRVVSLLGNRVLVRLLDRCDNRRSLDTPKIFYQDTAFPLQPGCYFSEDKNYLRANRGLIHESMVKAFLKHGYHRLNLEAAYTTVSTLVVEVPCGYSAAATVCLMMNLQEHALKSPGIGERLRWHLHAVVMAVMSLVAWSNKAVDLYKHINKIMKLRADEATHLNPPLRTVYEFAPHQVRWDRPDLFFEGWEVRYGLWMHFRKPEKAAEKTEVVVIQELVPL